MKKNTRTTWWICSNSKQRFAATYSILLTFVRHGSTRWNAEHRFQGRIDVPLDEQGRAQAQALAAFLGCEPFDYVVSSDLSRALDTARAICPNKPVHIDPRWREFAFGEWEGLTWEEIVARRPDLREHGRTAARSYAPGGGESFAQVRRRVADALRELEQSAHRHVLVVTHAGPLHAMLHTYFGEREVRFDPASVTRVEVASGRARLLALNETAPPLSS